MDTTCTITGCTKQRTWAASPHCWTHYRRLRKTGRPDAYKGCSQEPLDRFLASFTPGEADECWPWTGPINITNGYGRMITGPRTARHETGAHRFAYLHSVGPIPDNLVLDHACHSADLTCPGGRICQHRRCVNPAHLEVVTRGENTRRGSINRYRKLA